MIQNFRDKEAESFFSGYAVSDFHAFDDQLRRRLSILDSAKTLRDLAALRSNRLESLSGSRAGQYSIRVNRQWRICFRWGEEGPYDVEVMDYH